MQPVVVFADIEAYVIGYLNDSLPDFLASPVLVTNEAPDSDEGAWPARLVVVRRDGGRRDGLLEFPRLGVRTWALTDADATDLALLVSALIVACPDGQPVTRSQQLSGPSSLPEENDHKLRYCTFELTARGSALVPA